MAEIETLGELKSGNMFVEAVRGHKGVYFALQKGENALCLTVQEALALNAFMSELVLEPDHGAPHYENFDSEPE